MSFTTDLATRRRDAAWVEMSHVGEPFFTDADIEDLKTLEAFGFHVIEVFE